MLLNPFMSQALIIAIVSGYGVVLFLFSFSFRLLWFYDDGWVSSCVDGELYIRSNFLRIALVCCEPSCEKSARERKEA